MSCCPDFERRGRYLFTSFRSVGCKPAAFCPWCGKGVTEPAKREAYNPLTVRQTMNAVRQAKDWPRGNPDCGLCKGQGWTLKRIGCCQIKPVPCTCLAAKSQPGGPA